MPEGARVLPRTPYFLVLKGLDTIQATANTPSTQVESLEEGPGPPVGTAQDGLDKPLQVSEHIKCLKSQRGAGAGGSAQRGRGRNTVNKTNIRREAGGPWQENHLPLTDPRQAGRLQVTTERWRRGKGITVDCASPGGP